MKQYRRLHHVDIKGTSVSTPHLLPLAKKKKKGRKKKKNPSSAGRHEKSAQALTHLLFCSPSALSLFWLAVKWESEIRFLV
jgi:hypothetical protein